MCDPIWKGSRDREVAAEQVLLINLDDVEDGIKELERAARLGLSGAMITEYPAEDRRYDQSEYEPFWAAAEALDLPLSLHATTRRQGKICGAGDKALRDASSRATKAFYPALSLCDLIFSGVFERHPRLKTGHRGVRAGVGAPPAVHHGLHLPRAPRRGDLPVQEPALAKAGGLPSRRRGACPREGGGRHAPERLLPPQRRAELPGGRDRHSPARRHTRWRDCRRPL